MPFYFLRVANSSNKEMIKFDVCLKTGKEMLAASCPYNLLCRFPVVFFFLLMETR